VCAEQLVAFRDTHLTSGDAHLDLLTPYWQRESLPFTGLPDLKSGVLKPHVLTGVGITAVLVVTFGRLLAVRPFVHGQ